MIGAHLHYPVHIRQRLQERILPFFRDREWIRRLDSLVIVTSTIAPFANLPQIVRIYTTQQAGQLALSTWITFAVLNIPMFAYGMVHRERTIIGYTSGALCMEAFIIAGILMYG